MKAMFTKRNGTLLAAAVLALAGMIIYMITSMTGYLAAAAVNPWPAVCTIGAVMMLGAAVFMNHKLPQTVKDILVMASSLLLLVSFYYFVMARVQLAADVYFIPVNYPASEASALHISIAGAALYLLADIGLIAAAFWKDKEPA